MNHFNYIGIHKEGAVYRIEYNCKIGFSVREKHIHQKKKTSKQREQMRVYVLFRVI